MLESNVSHAPSCPWHSDVFDTESGVIREVEDRLIQSPWAVEVVIMHQVESLRPVKVQCLKCA